MFVKIQYEKIKENVVAILMDTRIISADDARIILDKVIAQEIPLATMKQINNTYELSIRMQDENLIKSIFTRVKIDYC